MSGQPQVRRWKRYGHDRLYVSLPEGDRIGWFDLTSGNHELDQPAYEVDFWRAVDEYRDSTAVPPPAPDAAVPPAPPPPTPATSLPVPPAAEVPPSPAADHPQPATPVRDELPERDLADNLPGANAAARAARLRAQRPVAYRLARLAGIRTRDRSWAVGAAGERRTGRTLARLPDGWYVLHAVQIGTRGTDIDHLVLGPGGVFTINTKHHRGARVEVGDKAVFVQGRPRPYVDAARREATRTVRALSAAVGYPVTVAPVVAIVGAREVRRWRARQPWGVKVLPRRALRRYLRWRGRTLTEEQVAQLYAAARRPATWLHA
jgi:hypothetical protein